MTNLFDERSFMARSEALEALELEDAFGTATADLRSRLEAIDAALFARLREEIRARHLRGDALRTTIEAFVPPTQTPAGRYDHLDAFLTELLLHRPLPASTKPLEREMVFYQRTPSRIVLELAQHLQPHDVFIDIGSGLGEVAVLVNLLTNVRTKAIEYETAYCDYALQLARDLALDNIEFVNEDARTADLSDGTVFFLYTPFTGSMLRKVLARLPSRAKVFTYGPCTLELGGSSEVQLTMRPSRM